MIFCDNFAPSALSAERMAYTIHQIGRPDWVASYEVAFGGRCAKCDGNGEIPGRKRGAHFRCRRCDGCGWEHTEGWGAHR